MSCRVSMLVVVLLTTVAEGQSNKGTLLTGVDVPLREVVSANDVHDRLPRGSEPTRVLRCTYRALVDENAREDYYFWLDAEPPWVSGMPHDGPLRTLIPRAASSCATRLMPWGPPEFEAPRVTGAMRGRGTVFATPLSSKEGLQGRWTKVTTVPYGPTVTRMLTETALLQVDGDRLVARAIEYDGDMYCLRDVREGRRRCYQLASYEDSFAVIEPYVDSRSAFDLVETLEFIPQTGLRQYSAADIEQARIATADREGADAASAAALMAAYNAGVAADAAARKAEREASGFVTTGLQHTQVFIDLFDGSLDSIPVTGDDPFLAALVNQYVESYAASSCRLPVDRRVELLRRVCDSRTVNARTGEVVDPCSESHWEGRGVYADPELNEFREWLALRATAGNFNLLRDVPAGAGFAELIEKGLEKVGERSQRMLTAASDVRTLFTVNSCSSSGMQRFQANLIALGRRLTAK